MPKKKKNNNMGIALLAGGLASTLLIPGFGIIGLLPAGIGGYQIYKQNRTVRRYNKLGSMMNRVNRQGNQNVRKNQNAKASKAMADWDSEIIAINGKPVSKASKASSKASSQYKTPKGKSKQVSKAQSHVDPEFEAWMRR